MSGETKKMSVAEIEQKLLSLRSDRESTNSQLAELDIEKIVVKKKQTKLRDKMQQIDKDVAYFTALLKHRQQEPINLTNDGDKT